MAPKRRKAAQAKPASGSAAQSTEDDGAEEGTTTAVVEEAAPPPPPPPPPPAPPAEPVFPREMLLEVPRPRPAISFAQDLEDMLFGFGDCYPADPKVVALMDSVVQAYVRDLALRALRVADCRAGLAGHLKLDKDCFLFAVRKEGAKFTRAHRLLAAHEEIRSVNKVEYRERGDPE